MDLDEYRRSCSGNGHVGAGLRGKGSEDVSPGVRGRNSVLVDEGGVTPCVSSRHLCCRLGGTSGSRRQTSAQSRA